MAEASGEEIESTSDSEEATSPETDTQADTDTETDSDELAEENYIQVLDPQGDPESDDLAPTLWGRFWGMSEGESIAFYWQFNPRALENSSSFENDIPDESASSDAEDGEETEGTDTNGTSTRLFNEQLYAAFGEPASLETYDPAIRRLEFKKRLQDYTVDDSPVPQVMIDDLKQTFSDYLEKPKVIWLRDFIESGEYGEINGWFSRVLEEIDPSEDYRYQLQGQLIDPTSDSVEVLDEKREEPEPSDDEGDDEDEDQSVRTLSISLMTDPSNGIEPTELREGMEVFYRIVGDVEFLPEQLIDRERQETASTPMTGSIVSIETNPDIPGDRDADPENYRQLEVTIDEGIHGEGLAFKDDRIKVPIEDDEIEETATRDIVLLGILVALLLVILLLILYL